MSRFGKRGTTYRVILAIFVTVAAVAYLQLVEQREAAEAGALKIEARDAAQAALDWQNTQGTVPVPGTADAPAVLQDPDIPVLSDLQARDPHELPFDDTLGWIASTNGFTVLAISHRSKTATRTASDRAQDRNRTEHQWEVCPYTPDGDVIRGGQCWDLTRTVRS